MIFKFLGVIGHPIREKEMLISVLLHVYCLSIVIDYVIIIGFKLSINNIIYSLYNSNSTH